MKNTELQFNLQDIAFVLFRAVLLAGLGFGVHTFHMRTTGLVPTADLWLAIGVGIGVVILGFLLSITSLTRPAVPVLLIVGDAFTAFLLFNLTHNSFNNSTDPALLVAIAGGLIVSGVFYLEFTWGVAQAIGVVIALIVSLGLYYGFERLAFILDELTLPVSVVGLTAVLGVGWRYVQQQQAARELSSLKAAQEASGGEIESLREQTRAIYELAATLSATLDFEKVLQATLEAGYLGMRKRTGRHLVSVVMLFRGDAQLHVVTGRGLSRKDNDLQLSGQVGLIGQALDECVPIIGKDVRHDPELQYFVGMQAARSVLCIPLRAGFDNYGVLVYASEFPNAFTEEHTDLLQAIGIQATIALQNAVLYRNLVEEKERIVEVDEDARKKLARDLHDGPTQNISAIAMRMSYIYRLLERTPEDVPVELKKVEELARRTTKEIRHMLFTLRPLVLESQGLEAALKQLAEKVYETHSQAVSVRVDHQVGQVLDGQAQGVIFYIVEEAVGNARKHAEAELISVDISHRRDVVVVEVSDNGVGFDTGAVDANYDQRGSLGMVNMRERTELLEGSLRIESAEGRGTTITVLVPVKSRAEATPHQNTPALANRSGESIKLPDSPTSSSG